jgi:serine/threonine protein kinase
VVKEIAAQIMIGLIQLQAKTGHTHDYGYYDLNPFNISVDYQGFCYLTDFGFDRCFDRVLKKDTGAFYGTVEYTAPERFWHKFRLSDKLLHSTGQRKSEAEEHAIRAAVANYYSLGALM